MPTALGSHPLGVDEGMEPREQGGVALGSASAMPEALPGTIGEGERGCVPGPRKAAGPRALGDPNVLIP